MALPEAIQTRLSDLSKRFHDCEATLQRLLAAESYDEHKKVRDEDFISIFRDVCALVREAETTNPPYLLELLDAAQKVLDEGIGIAYGRSELFDFMPSWAHDDQRDRPLIEDHREVILPLPHSAFPELLRIFGIKEEEIKAKVGKMRPDPWSQSMKRHPKSTPLARFRPQLPNLTATPTSRLAMSVYDARCEILSTDISLPIRLQLSESNSCLFMTAMTGYKNRSPGLEYFFLDQEDKDNDFLESYNFEPGLADIAYHMAIDESRSLIFVGDESRVKSYVWGNPDGTHYDELLPMHTLNSSRHSGPIAILPGGNIARAGKGGVAVWDKGVETHGDEEKQIGEKISIEDTWRDDDDEIEQSSGSLPTSRIDFVDHPNLKPFFWKPLIESPSTVLCVDYARDSSHYGCVAIDLEAGGKTRAQYLGHGGAVSDISVSAADPHVFLTACSDGFARLYDARQSLPVLTFDACGQDASCEAVALAHPDGIPTVFTGTERHEQIKVWDVRARGPVYELATGNNAVQSLAWDAKRNCLYAATQCSYLDRLGYHHEYRHARIPRRANANETGVNGDETMDEDESDEEDYEQCWPGRAWHAEDYYGYTFDAGEHRIYRYAFKEDPDTSILPRYGDATIDSGW